MKQSLSQGTKEEGTHTTPIWAKVFGLLAIIFILLIGILHLTGKSPKGHHTMSIIEYGVKRP